MTNIDETTRTWHNANVQNQREIGLYIVKTLILLNGAGIVLLLTLLSAATSEAAFVVAVSAMQQSALGFLLGIVFALVTATSAYAVALYSNPFTGETEIPVLGNKWVEPGYFISVLGSIACFVCAVLIIISGVSPQ
ncbi:hypothetical protein [uncultured Tateyamaria sp.]|uniref:hypothetical protein n=1 Tax=uncultured Tateyamaria sp. TaxID=455651 RepID=UPI00263942FB|nr:hypothetical protein [uncultured Tateyamaria sp.]